MDRNQPGAETVEQVNGQETDSPKGKESNVPLAALLSEREKFHGREKELRDTIDTMGKELSALKAQMNKDIKEAAPEDKDQIRKQWREYLNLDAFDKKIQALEEKLGTLDKLAEKLPEIEHGSSLAFTNYTRGVELYVEQQYDKTIPVTKEVWSKMVAAEMTDQEAAKIANGDTSPLNTVIERAKKSFQGMPILARAKEAAHVRNLPKSPAPGGTSPGSGREENKFTSLRDLHKMAAEDFVSIKARDQE